MSNKRPAGSLFRVSEAANLALHATAALAGGDGQMARTRELAAGLRVSEAHLAKVMMTLERAGLVTGTRGPAGGYRLARPAERISLAEVYEAVEGPLAGGRCIFGIPVCNGRGCLLGGYFGRVTREAVAKLRKTKLSALAVATGGNRGKKA